MDMNGKKGGIPKVSQMPWQGETSGPGTHWYRAKKTSARTFTRKKRKRTGGAGTQHGPNLTNYSVSTKIKDLQSVQGEPRI